MSRNNKKFVKNERLTLPMKLVGEQTGVAAVEIPYDKFTLTSDGDFLKNADDDERDSKFIYAYTESGVSNNSRNWSQEIMKSIGDQVVEKLPPGYLGHIKPTNYGFEFPEPQVVWFGSYAEQLPAPAVDSVRLWLKGYLLPTATDLETWIKAKAVNSISVYGGIEYVVDDGGVTQISAVDLKSIDISRKLAEGLSSQIVGLSGEMSENASEMDVAYDDVRRSISDQVKAMLGAKFPPRLIDGEARPPYIYAWVRCMYVNTNKAVVECEVPNSTGGSMTVNYEVTYVIDETDGTVTVNDKFVEVNQVTSFVPVKKENQSLETEDVGEMAKSLQELKTTNPALYTQLKTELAGEMQSETKTQVLVAKAGEMDEVGKVLAVGEGASVVDAVKKLLSNNKTLAGEMSKLFCGEQEGGEPAPVETIVANAQQVVADKDALDKTVKAVEEIVKPEEGQTVVEAVTNVVNLQQVALAKQAVVDVNAKFDELTKDVDDEVVKEYARDDFAAYLNAKPEDIKDADWKEKAEKAITDGIEACIKKHQERLSKLSKTAKAAGEMSAVVNLGGNKVQGGAPKADPNVDSDIAEAKRLGYC